ncbi:hypothetical protein [Nonomuraea typhae]|uniref:hypothetical protein n=1 Tax=Nonomuraea typhae TaxID=2603600 RepID=UPI003CCE0A0E
MNVGVSIEAVRRRLGHASAETTQLYTLLADDDAGAETAPPDAAETRQRSTDMRGWPTPSGTRLHPHLQSPGELRLAQGDLVVDGAADGSGRTYARPYRPVAQTPRRTGSTCLISERCRSHATAIGATRSPPRGPLPDQA